MDIQLKENSSIMNVHEEEKKNVENTKENEKIVSDDYVNRNNPSKKTDKDSLNKILKALEQGRKVG